MLTVVDASTALVLTVNVALVAPAAIVTLDGVLATFVLLLESVTTAPPEGAAPLSVTVPVEECPPVTLLGSTGIEERGTARRAGAGATTSGMRVPEATCETDTTIEPTAADSLT